MKVLIVISLLVLAISNVQCDKNRSYKNLAVMLAYKPNSEITTKDENNKRWTYKVNNKSDEEDKDLNEKLMELLRKQKLAKYINELSDKTTVKRENQKRDAASSSLCEASNEDIDDAKIVELNKEKHSCYKNTYQNVLNAFEEALKSQIKSYKKCVCEKKPTTTSSTTTTTTTEAPKSDEDDESVLQLRLDAEDDESNENGESIKLGNERELDSAAHHPDDIICFHKQYAFMLNKLLDRIPCERKSGSNLPSSIDEYNGGDTNVRSERNNVPISSSLESIELDVSSIPHKAAAKSADSEDDLREQILAVLKEHLNGKKVESGKKKTTTTTTTTTSTTPAYESSEGASNEEEFLSKLKRLFQQLEDDEQSFPVSNGKSNADSATPVSPHKSQKKSKGINEIANGGGKQLGRKARKSPSVVSENSDESTEVSIKLKNARQQFQKQHFQPKEGARENPKSAPKAKSTSYRTAARAAASESKRVNDSAEAKEAPKKSLAEGPSAHDDSRLANDLAKALSDYARKYLNA
jgi:hypothetical protein